jgi:acyl-CoA reductase-like NAD-dependent aldehyde dehydrogenase
MRPQVRMLSEMAVSETGMGRVEDKINKNLLAINKTPGVEDLSSTAYTGDNGLTLVEMAPYGLIGSITPSTNSSETLINNSISMISAGNAVVFNPHPAAKKISCKTIELINGAIQAAGGPPDLVTTVMEPSMATSNAIMKHPRVRLLVVTGGPEVVKVAMNSGKKVIAAGPGNPPVVVDETADIPKAARDIVLGASLDNNIVCIAEKEIFAISSIADQLKMELCRNGAYELDSRALDKLMEKIVSGKTSDGHLIANRNFVGRNASVIANSIGIKIPDEIRLLISEVPPNHPLVLMEQLMPVMPFSRVKTIEEAFDWALKVEHGFFHTSMMHSRNVENLSRMASIVNTTIFVKNAPSYAGLGMGGEGYTTFTIASPTGEGLTSARTFTRQRRCTLADYFRIV